MSKLHTDRAEALPMSGPTWAGTPIAYRVLGWAGQKLGRAHEALFILREQTPEEFYPLDICFGDNPNALNAEGLLLVAARRLARAADSLAECCGELDSSSLALLQAETAPAPTILRTEALPVAEQALDVGLEPPILDHRSALKRLSLLVRAFRLSATAMIASESLDQSEVAVLQGALAPFEARSRP